MKYIKTYESVVLESSGSPEVKARFKQIRKDLSKAGIKDKQILVVSGKSSGLPGISVVLRDVDVDGSLIIKLSKMKGFLGVDDVRTTQDRLYLMFK